MKRKQQNQQKKKTTNTPCTTFQLSAKNIFYSLMCEYVYVSFFSRVRLVIVAVSAAALVQPTDAIALNGEIAEKQPNRIHHARNHNKKKYIY